MFWRNLYTEIYLEEIFKIFSLTYVQDSVGNDFKFINSGECKRISFDLVHLAIYNFKNIVILDLHSLGLCKSNLSGNKTNSKSISLSVHSYSIILSNFWSSLVEQIYSKFFETSERLDTGGNNL